MRIFVPIATLLALVGAAVAQSPESSAPQFRIHHIDADSEFSAAAAIDVDRNGRLDIVSGEFWYAAPDWTRHKLREVPRIRGRADDYSNLPLDVNGDGLTDLVSANYRSQTLRWIEQPDDVSQLWPVHEIARPGAMETARLFDVDSDGRLDVLPASKDFSAWWSIRESGDADLWQRFPLPEQLAGHSNGFGDLNADGRGDVIGLRGWAKAPANPRTQRWVFHDEFRLHADAGNPVLVHDVDGDGDADLIWARGHNIGLYWLENAGSAAEPSWVQRAIDTQVSHFHSLLLADLDGNGRMEVIGGKRYFGHGGKDPGEWTPSIVAAYQFQPDTRTWQKSVLSDHPDVGWDLDPKAVDLDGDGDTDLLCPTRDHLAWLENLGTDDGDSPVDPPRIAFEDPRNLLVVADGEGDARQPVTDMVQWGRRRAHILDRMQIVMGPLPGSENRVPLNPQWGDPIDEGTYVRRHVVFNVAPGDSHPEQSFAWLLVPKAVDEPAPAMLCLHPTFRMAKDELAGLDGARPNRQYAKELAQHGYVCLVPDYPSFGEAADYDFQANRDRYESGTMKAIWDNTRAVDLLESLPEVDGDRIGAIGHSLGGHNSLYTAAFDQRIRAVVTSCGFTAFHHYYEGNLKGWTSDRYMPAIADRYHNNPDEVPFDFYEVLAAIAPRPVFVAAPVEDHNFEITGVRKVVEAVRPVYDLLRTRPTQQIKLVTPPGGHDFPPDIREQAYAWLDTVLAR